MRKNCLKTVILAVVALVSFAANAQELGKFNIRKGDWTSKQIVDTLSAFPQDTLRILSEERVAGDTVQYFYKKYWTEGKKFMVADGCITHVTKKVDLQSIYQKQVDSRLAEHLVGDRLRDTYYAKVDGLKGVKENDEDASKIVLKSKNKYGWSLNFYGGYQFASNLSSPVVGAGIEFTQPKFMLAISAEYGHSKFTEVAVNAGKRYGTYRTELIAGWQPFVFDKFNQNRLFLYGGLGWEYYGTDSPKNEDGSYITSWGNYLYPTAGVRYEHRMFSTGNSWWAQIGWRQLQGVVQNNDPIKNNAVVMTVGFNLGLFRNKVQTVSNKELKTWIKNY